MSETLTFDNGAQARIYGTLAGVLTYLGSESEEWDDIATDEALQRLAVRAGRYLDHLPWEDDYATFAARDGLDLADGSVGDAAFPFRAAAYELMRLARADESILTVPDQSSNIQSLGAGGAQVTYFSPTSVERGTAPMLPPVLMKLIGGYLQVPSLAAGGGRGQEGSCSNPFSTCSSGRTDGW